MDFLRGPPGLRFKRQPEGPRTEALPTPASPSGSFQASSREGSLPSPDPALPAAVWLV